MTKTSLSIEEAVDLDFFVKIKFDFVWQMGMNATYTDQAEQERYFEVGN